MCNNSHVELFADDVKIFRKVETLQDIECIQLTLDKILLWSNNWRIEISADKCICTCVGYSSLPFDCLYHINNINLTSVLMFQT